LFLHFAWLVFFPVGLVYFTNERYDIRWHDVEWDWTRHLVLKKIENIVIADVNMKEAAERGVMRHAVFREKLRKATYSSTFNKKRKSNTLRRFCTT
jgi:hypothetical protein